MIDEEFEQYKLDVAASIIEDEKIEAEMAAQDAVRTAGHEKLKALGLTDAEIVALVG